MQGGRGVVELVFEGFGADAYWGEKVDLDVLGFGGFWCGVLFGGVGGDFCPNFVQNVEIFKVPEQSCFFEFVG